MVTFIRFVSLLLVLAAGVPAAAQVSYPPLLLRDEGINQGRLYRAIDFTGRITCTWAAGVGTCDVPAQASTDLTDSSNLARLSAVVNAFDGSASFVGNADGVLAVGGIRYSHVLLSVGLDGASPGSGNPLTHQHQVGVYAAHQANSNTGAVDGFVAGFETAIGLNGDGFEVPAVAAYAVGVMGSNGTSFATRTWNYQTVDQTLGTSNAVLAPWDSTFSGDYWLYYDGARPSVLAGGDLTVPAEMYRFGSTGYSRLSGGNSAGSGASAILFAQSHPTNANQGQLNASGGWTISGDTAFNDDVTVTGTLIGSGNASVAGTFTVLNGPAVVNSNGVVTSSFANGLNLGTWDAFGYNSAGTHVVVGGYRASQWTGVSFYTGGTERMRIEAGGVTLQTALSIANGGSGLTSIGADAVIVGDDATSATAQTLPSCSNATTSKLLYNSSTNTFSCGTDQDSGGGSSATTLTLGSNVSTGANTTLVDITGMSFTADAGGIYEITIFATMQSPAAGTGYGIGINCAQTPVLVSLTGTSQLANTGTSSQWSSIADDAIVGVTSGVPANGTNVPTHGGGIIRAHATNSGTCIFRLRSETTAVTTMMANSIFVIRKTN